MQTSSLASSLTSSRGQTFARGSSGDSFRKQFDAFTRGQEGLRDNPVGYQAQDERSIRKTALDADEQSISRNKSVREVERTRESRDVDTQSESTNQNEPTRAPEATENDTQDETSADSEQTAAQPKQRSVKKDEQTAEGESTSAPAVMIAQTPVQADAEAAALDGTIPLGAASEIEQAQGTQLAVDSAQKLALASGNGVPSAGDDAGPSADAAPAPAKPPVQAKPETTATPVENTGDAAQAGKAVEAAAKGEAEGEPSDLLSQPTAKAGTETKPAGDKPETSAFDRQLQTLQTDVAGATKSEANSAPRFTPQPSLTPEQKFVQDNVDQVVTTVRAQSLQGGGQMHVRLDPPELGALQVAVKMIDGRLTASFTTSNEQATQLLSHSLQHLRSSLEASGVNVDRIEVRQAPPSDSSNNRSGSDSQQQGQQRGFDAHSQQSEQQRKEMVRRMWRKLAYGSDDLDLVA